MAKQTLATKIRNDLNLLSLRGKKSWSEAGRGKMVAQSSSPLLGEHTEYFEGLGFVLERNTDTCESWVWPGTSVEVLVTEYMVDISYLLASREWNEEQGVL